MSSSTYIRFFTLDEVAEPERFCGPILRLFRAREDMADVTRTVGEDTSWADRESEDYEGPEFDLALKRMSLEAAVGMYVPGRVLTVNWFSQDEGLAYRLIHEIYDALSPEVRGEVGQGHPALTLGWHDVFASGDEGERYIGRASMSQYMWGYGIPPEMARYRSEVLRLGSVREIVEGLSAITGAEFRCEVYPFL